jgi:hypothetical protein
MQKASVTLHDISIELWLESYLAKCRQEESGVQLLDDIKVSQPLRKSPTLLTQGIAV